MLASTASVTQISANYCAICCHWTQHTNVHLYRCNKFALNRFNRP